MRKNIKNLALFLLLVFFASFMGNGHLVTAISNASNSSNSSNSSQAGEATVYPYEFKGMDGKSVIVEKEPEKIVSLSPTFTEILFALGEGKNLVGRTDYCDYPKETSEIVSVGSMSKPSVEKIVELNPDIVIVSFLKPEVVEQIEKAGIKVIQITAGDSFEGSYKNIEEVARITNSTKEAKEVISGIKSKIEEVSNKVKDAKKVTSYYVAGFGEGGDYTAGDKTFINDIITAAGGENVAKDAEGWKYTAEKLLEKNPEIIIIGSMAKMTDAFKTTEPYKNLDAVKNNKVMEVDDNLINREGPRMGEAVEMLAKIFHPELFQ